MEFQIFFLRNIFFYWIQTIHVWSLQRLWHWKLMVNGDIKRVTMLTVKTITSVLKVLTYIIISIATLSISLTDIPVIKPFLSQPSQRLLFYIHVYFSNVVLFYLLKNNYLIVYNSLLLYSIQVYINIWQLNMFKKKNEKTLLLDPQLWLKLLNAVCFKIVLHTLCSNIIQYLIYMYPFTCIYIFLKITFVLVLFIIFFMILC